MGQNLRHRLAARRNGQTTVRDTRRPRTRPLPIRQPQIPAIQTTQIRNPLPLHRSRSNKAGINNTLSINQQETQDG